MSPAIDIHALNFSYGSVPTLSGIDLGVAEGEFLGIVGPNARGKSRLLASIGCGVMGTYVVVKRIAFVASGIAHSVLGGMGAAVCFGFDPLHGALPAAIAAALLLGAVLSIAGLALSYGPDLPAGPTIILLAGGAYVLSAMIAQVLDRRRARLAATRGVRRGETRE